MRIKPVASDSRKNSAQCNYNSSMLTAKRCFQEVLLDLVSINFRNCGTSIDPGNRLVDTGDVFDVSNVPFQQSSEAAVSCGAAAGALVAILLT